uniref:ISY1 splicing factor homolog n=1 Tax=Sinocyclocheilus grahami TaxID=75366 RepID=A0A672LCP1_SINGR
IFDFSEKCLTALARFHQAQLQEGKLQERTPVLASECNELPKAEKWRRREVSKKVTQIQNDLNDEINKGESSAGGPLNSSAFSLAFAFTGEDTCSSFGV